MIGVDSLRYFWTRRQPDEVARDLSSIMAAYAKRWRVRHVLLVGYSFGADILPAAVDRLPAADRARIAQISLLGLSPTWDDQVSVSGWLGVDDAGDGRTLDDLKGIDLRLVQCVYGEEEGEETACPALANSPAELIRTAGGHHFDGDYEALAATILAGLDRRLRTAPADAAKP